jgi:hypothetical protein
LKNNVLYSISRFALPLFIFIIITLFLTFNVLSLPTLVIGDNFHWSLNNINDIIGPKVTRESYMGDIGVLSTFKSGFLFPLTYILSSFNLPSTIVYPFLFYVLAMLSFYFFSKEFIENKALRILAGVLYLINPITPYYYASIINAFSIILLPLGLKFFVRSLREVKSQQKTLFIRNLAFASLFLGLTVSANEQLVLSVLLVSVFLLVTFVFTSYRSWGLTNRCLKVCLVNLSIFAMVFAAVCLPLFISLNNIQGAPLSTYFQSSSSNFLQTVQYTYKTADLGTLLRLGGDSGAGLGTNSWYDINSITNYFGYAILGFFMAAILLLAVSTRKRVEDRPFFIQGIILFIVSLALIFIMKNMDATSVSNTPLAWILRAWETPIKLRVLILISVLTTSLLLFKFMDSSNVKKKKALIGLTLTVLIIATVVYNSSWVINYAGETPLQQIADSSKWGTLYDQTYVAAASIVEQQSLDSRGIILPYTHKAELYSDPNTRIFQTMSAVNDETSQIISGNNVSWSKTLGLYSIKSLAVMNTYDPNDGLIFPRPAAYTINSTLEQIQNDKELTPFGQTKTYSLYDSPSTLPSIYTTVNSVSDDSGTLNNEVFLQPTAHDVNVAVQKIQNELTPTGQSQNYTVYNNPNALPLTYVTNNYNFYDDIGTLKYALNYVNFAELPVFLNQQYQIGHLTIPSSIGAGTYELHALALTDNSTKSLAVAINNGAATRTINLGKQNSGDLSDFSAQSTLSPGDQVMVLNPNLPQTTHINDQTLDYSNCSIGSLGSFSLDFTVNVLQRGNMSFLSPRVLIDNGNEVYYIILHDSGYVELAVLKDGVFYSAVMYQYVGYSLLNPSDSINVKVTRELDEVNVYINGNSFLTFPIAPTTANVSLTSEKSTSKFSNIDLTQSDTIRLFATRTDSTPVQFKAQNEGADSSSIKVSSSQTDFAVVSQYLYDDQRIIENNLRNTGFRANVLFQGWIINSAQTLSNQEISIGINGLQISYGLTALSIVFTYTMLTYIAKPDLLEKFSQNIKLKIKKGKVGQHAEE